MAVIPVLIDARPEYLREAGAGFSLLAAPTGAGSLAEAALRALRGVCGSECAVLPAFATTGEYALRVRALLEGHAEVFAVANTDELLERCEPSDWLLLVDVTHFPFRSFDPALLARAMQDPRGVTHFVATNRGQAAAQERVCLDTRGAVQRIQRYYRGVTLARTDAVCCTLASGAAARAVLTMPSATLRQMRERLAALHVPGRDVFLPDSAFDLEHARGLLELNEQLLCGMDWAGGDDLAAPTTARVHPTARLYGPVIAQEGAVVEAGAVVIGPTVLGPGSRVRERATVAQCVLLPGATTARAGVFRQQVIATRPAAPARRARAAEPASDGPPARPLQQPRPRATPANCVHAPPPRQVWYGRAKRAVDLTITATALLVLSPLLALVALAIWLGSGRPILYGDEREGRGGRVFRCWKFRTMVKDAAARQRALYRVNQVDGPQFKLKNDTRITPVGRFLRATNIDELPQLLNVLVGEMSLIGPRPSPFRENQICVPWREARLSVRPGITGLWQMCRADRGTGDFHQWIYYDILYVRHMSLALDLKILLATILTMGGHRSVPLRRFLPNHVWLRHPEAPLPRHAPILTGAPLPDALTLEPVNAT